MSITFPLGSNIDNFRSNILRVQKSVDMFSTPSSVVYEVSFPHESVFLAHLDRNIV